MPRTARQIIPDTPHHVIQRGNRNQQTFFSDHDYALYLNLLKDKLAIYDTLLLAYCLMPNHVHLVLQPNKSAQLQAVPETHKAYARFINKRNGWSGHFWQGRYASYPMDERYLYHAVRYVELNPVFAGICQSPEEYRWSSARQRLYRPDSQNDLKVTKPLDHMVENWQDYWKEGLVKAEMNSIFMQNEVSQNPLTTGTSMGTLQFEVSPRDS